MVSYGLVLIFKSWVAFGLFNKPSLFLVLDLENPFKSLFWLFCVQVCLVYLAYLVLAYFRKVIFIIYKFLKFLQNFRTSVYNLQVWVAFKVFELQNSCSSNCKFWACPRFSRMLGTCRFARMGLQKSLVRMGHPPLWGWCL